MRLFILNPKEEKNSTSAASSHPKVKPAVHVNERKNGALTPPVPPPKPSASDSNKVCSFNFQCLSFCSKQPPCSANVFAGNSQMRSSIQN